jgi:hypothetical protein
LKRLFFEGNGEGGSGLVVDESYIPRTIILELTPTKLFNLLPATSAGPLRDGPKTMVAITAMLL